MGVLGDRINAFVEAGVKSWKERLRGWAISIVDLGVQGVLHAIGKSVAPLVKPLIEKAEKDPDFPEELKALFAAVKEPTGQGQALLSALGGGAVVGGASTAMLGPYFARLNMLMSKYMWWQLVPPALLYANLLRGNITEEDVRAEMKRAGWSDTRMKAFEWLSHIIPDIGDLIRMAVREAFTPEIAEKFGQYEDYPDAVTEWGEKQGLSKEWLQRYWAAHWDLPSAMLGYEMLHRGIITEDELKMLLRALDVMPFWRGKLVDISWNVPTRVDVRRFWDMRTIDEARLREVYTALGYHGKDLDDYVLWTKVYCGLPDLLARWSKGWITLDEVRGELTKLGMPKERVEEIIETKVKATQAERTVKEKDLTKAELVKGVKQEVITRDEGVELLMDLGYDEDEAVYILAINVPEDEQVSQVKARELTKADILGGLKAEVITEQEAVTKLEGLRYTPDDAQFIVKIYMASVKPPVEPRAKEVAKADILLAVKKGLITPEDGYLMLQDIGYTPEAAQFILTVRAEESPFSPVSYDEFKDLTGKWRLAAGKEVKPMPEELKKAGAEVVRITKEVESLKRAVAEEEKGLIAEEPLPEAATKKLKQLQVALHRAEAALTAAKTNYDSLLAQWRHGV